MKKISEIHSDKAGAHPKMSVRAMSRSAKIIALLLSFAGLLMGATNAHALACTSVATGNWGVAGTWTSAGNCNRVPTAADTVTIATGHTVTVNVATANVQSVTVNTGGILTQAQALSAAGALSVAGTLTSNNAVTVTGATNITGTLTISASAAARTFTGLVTVTGGTWNNSGNRAVTFRGGITNNGTFTAGTGTQTFNLTQAIGGANPINFGGIVAVANNVTVTNNNTNAVTIVGNLTGGNASSIWVNAANSTLNYGGATAPMGTRVFTASAVGNTVNYNRAGAQTVKAPSGVPATYYHLTLSGSGVKTMPTLALAPTMTVLGNFTMSGAAATSTTALQPLTVSGNFTLAALNTFTAGTFLHSVGGNWSNSGVFTAAAGTGTVTFTGANSTLGGTVATTFNNLTINKTVANNVSIVCGTLSPTVNATLALTSGKIITCVAIPCAAEVPIVVAAAGTVAGGSATSYVQGALRKNFALGATLNFRPIAGQDEFPVGDAANYTPIEITAGTTSTAGSVTACVTPTDHPQVTTPVATTGIDALMSVNRYWSLTTAGITTTAALVDATFKFVAGDVDVGATTANFIVENYGNYWRPTTLVTAGATSTRASNIDLTSTVSTNNDIAIGDPLTGVTAVPGLYNAFETATPVGAILGKIQTKVAGTGFSVDIVHVNANKTGVSPVAIPVEVRLLDSSAGGVLDVNGCNATWPLIQALPTFNIPASGRGTIPAATVTNSYRSVRFQIRSPVGGPYTQIGCSTDLFAIRPQSLTVTAWDASWTTAGTSRQLNNIGAAGGTVHKAATALNPLPFTLRATPVPNTATNYDGSPTVVATFPTCGVLCTTVGGLSFTAASWTAAGLGVRENATANYSEAGTFNLQLEDSSYTSVDVVDGSTPAMRTVPATASAQIGRFVPDHFAVTATSIVNRADLVCPLCTFTYMGEQMNAVFTLTAQAAGNTSTQNYAGALAKLNPAAAGNPSGLAVSYAAVSTAAAGIGATTISVDTTVGFVAGDALWIPGAGAAGAALNATVASLTGNAITLSTPIVTAVPLGTNIERDLTASVNTSTAATGSFAAGVANVSAPLSVNRGATNWYPALNVGIAPADSDGVGLAVAALNLDAAYVAGNDHARIGATDVRYGVMKLANAYGSELLQLPVSVTAQYWNGTNYVTSSSDSVSSFAASGVIFGPYAGNLTAVNYPNSGGTSVTPASVVFVSGVASYTLAKPPTTGSVDMKINIPSYLPSNPARATFGVYKGAKEFIYQRENY